jgi:hypothetical protein
MIRLQLVFQSLQTRRRQRTVDKLAKEEQLSENVAANRKERKELEAVKAAKDAELKELMK